MMPFEKSADVRRLSFEALAVEFHSLDGRWCHAIKVHGETIAHSLDIVAGAEDPERPVSPTYQELHEDEVDGAPVLLLVGKNGPHHYSAVVRMALWDTGALLEFDIADRCRTPDRGPSATYRVARTSSDILTADGGKVVWRCAGTFTLEGVGLARLALAEAGRQATHVQVQSPLDSVRTTARLAYRWVWVP